MEIIKALGIDNYWVLIAQFVNLAVLLFVLYKFAYGPMMKMLDERSAKIAEGIKDAEKANKKLEETESREKDVLNKAKKEAKKIIAAAEEIAEKNKAEILENSKMEADEIFRKAEEKIEEEKNKLREELKKETIELVMMATEKVLKEKIDSDKDKEIIEKVVKN
ncbi:MAG: F0F1 ATP synthase subunit B [Candidatus Moranbacteria bacterium]|nr:F0F1 ATP synthase subunit B [Candidatus Moranbacteria bacterium]